MCGREFAMRTYVTLENIRRFREMLETEPSPERRRVLQAMLAEEEAKLGELRGKTDAGPPGDYSQG